MLKIAHIVHPVIVDNTSDLVIAQPITFETMRVARKFAEGAAKVKLYAAQYQDEERAALPRCFKRTANLKRSIIDIKTFKEKRKLALIKDILAALYESAKADYFIYTNVDIAVQPFFYRTVSKIIEQGYDAFVINRRTITGRYSTIHETPLMYGETGNSHPGYDCFVFKREVYPEFKLGDICIGTSWIGRALLINLCAYSGKFKEFKDLHLTFHIGDPRPWMRGEFSDYFRHNREELLRIFEQIEAERGKFEPAWRSYLIDFPKDRQFPAFA
jgi:hypothetical protein